MAIVRDGVPLTELPDERLLSILFALGFEIDHSTGIEARDNEFSGWRLDALVGEARRRGFTVVMRVSAGQRYALERK